MILLVALAALATCGGNDVDAPPVTLPDSSCPTLDDTLPNTLQALQDGRLDGIASIARDLQVQQGGVLLAEALRAVVLLVRSIPLEVGATVDFDAVRGLVRDIEPLLADVLQPFVSEPAGSDAGRDRLLAFDALGEVVAQCPEGSVLDAVGLLTSDPDFLAALQSSLKDPTLVGLVQSLPAPSGSSTSRHGFALLIDTMLNALLSQNFVFTDLVDLIAPFFPVDTPPLSTLLPPLERLLGGDGLETLRTLIRCLQDVERTPSDGAPRNGGLLLGAMLYDVIAAQSGSLADLLGSLEPIFARATDPSFLALLDAVVEGIQSDEELRQNLIDLLVFGLDIHRVGDLLHGVIALLEADSLQELLTVVENLFVNDQCSPTVDTSLSGGALELGLMGARLGVAIP